jgi:hypothetical protein
LKQHFGQRVRSFSMPSLIFSFGATGSGIYRT